MITERFDENIPQKVNLSENGGQKHSKL